MKFKKILAGNMALMLLISAFSQPVMATESFSDMPGGAAGVALRNAVNNGLLYGWDGRIMPNDSLTRAQMAAIINRAFSSYELADISSYADMVGDEWYYDDMAKGVQMRTFFGDGYSLMPNQEITREQAYAVIARAFKVELPETADNLAIYSDAERIFDGLKLEVAAMFEKGYVTNGSTTIEPNKVITREEFAVIMNRMVQQYITVEGEYTVVSKGNIMVNAPNVVIKDTVIDGDLIIGEGVGDGDLALENVEVTGQIIASGGGENSIYLRGFTKVRRFIMARLDGKLRLHASPEAKVDRVEVQAGKGGAIIEGNIGELAIGDTVPVAVANGTIGKMDINVPGAEVSLGENSEVEAIVLSEAASGATVDVSETATVGAIEVNAPDATLKGEGKVETVTVNADNAVVDTKGTVVEVADGVEGTEVEGKEVDGGETAKTEEPDPTTPKEEEKPAPAPDPTPTPTPTPTPSLSERLATDVNSKINSSISGTSMPKDVTVSYTGSNRTLTVNAHKGVNPLEVGMSVIPSVISVFGSYDAVVTSMTVGGKTIDSAANFNVKDADPVTFVNIAIDALEAMGYTTEPVFKAEEVKITVDFKSFSGSTINTSSVFTIKFDVK